MAKELRKEIMWPLKEKNEFKWRRSNGKSRQHNFCLNILQKTKKQYYISVTMKHVSCNKLFWKSVKPFFSDKISSSSKATLVEDNNIISKKEEIANIMSQYFANMKKSLNLKRNKSVPKLVIPTNSKIILLLKWYIRNILKHKKYIEIAPESFKFELALDIDAKKRKLRYQKVVNIRFCSSNYLKTMRECLFVMPHKFYESFSNCLLDRRLIYCHQNLQKLRMCPRWMWILLKLLA